MTNHLPYLSLIALPDGQISRSLRSEVEEETIALLHPWLVAAVAAGTPIPLPAKALSHCSGQALATPGGLVVTLYGPIGPHRPGHPHTGTITPLITFGVARRSRNAQRLWHHLINAFGGAASLTLPHSPWCAVALHVPPHAYANAWTWLSPLQRCLAWTYVARGLQSEMP